MRCLFCEIANGKTDTAILFENKNLAIFKDISQKAPIHLLVVPKRHIESIGDSKREDIRLLGEMILTAGKVAKKMKTDKGYRLIFNIGKKAGQEIDHIHLHLLGGW